MLMVCRRPFVGPTLKETTMKTPNIQRLVRLGAARKLTRAATDGDFVELNPARKYDIPVGE